jgi:hypothetical protein
MATPVAAKILESQRLIEFPFGTKALRLVRPLMS